MYKILVPVDGSDCALRALAFAIERAQELAGPSLHVLTVHPEPRVYGQTAVYAGKERMEELAAQRDTQVLSSAEEMLERSDVSYETEALEGEPAEVIARRATETGSQCIIMGTRGMGRIATLVMGSVATKVVHLSPVPVTLVK
jgi:nucleotide-binding universal stress UspA family protein